MYTTNKRELIEEFIDPEGQRGLRLNLHPGQVRAWRSTRRFVIVLAGTQSGKTSFFPALAVPRDAVERAG